MNLRKTFRRV